MDCDSFRDDGNGGGSEIFGDSFGDEGDKFCTEIVNVVSEKN